MMLSWCIILPFGESVTKYTYELVEREQLERIYINLAHEDAQSYGEDYWLATSLELKWVKFQTHINFEFINKIHMWATVK